MSIWNPEPGCIRVRDSKTAAGVRPVWLTKHCRNALIQWREFLGPGFSEYVFPSPRIPFTHVSDYKKAWQKAAHEAGLPDRRAYDLRASFASRANACHASGLTIAQLLGHANSTQILPTYVKSLDENTRAVIEALDAARTSQARNVRFDPLMTQSANKISRPHPSKLTAQRGKIGCTNR